MESRGDLVEPRRLHVTTLVQRVLLTVPGIFLLAIPYWRGDAAMPGFLLLIALLSAIYALFIFPLFVAWYLRFEYWVTPRELVIRHGVLSRQHRSIPIERIQNIEIQQPVMARLFGTARVIVGTAGSKEAEGTLEYVKLDEAHELRRVVREYQRTRPMRDAFSVEPVGVPDADAKGDASRQLITLPFGRVLLSGVYRFSLLYILIAFSAIQYLGVGPDTIVDWFTAGRLEPVTDVIAESPWLAALMAAVLASLFSWLAGIAVNINRFYGFTLARDDDKLHRRHGLLTVMEATIPLTRVQALLLRANAPMRHRGWAALRLQTMGVDTSQKGHQLAVPFGRLTEILALSPEIRPFSLPERFHDVSKLTIRRMTVRYTAMLLLAAVGGSMLSPTLVWLFMGWPLLPVLAYLQFRNHGFAFDGEHLFVRRGVFIHYIWVIPAEKFQVHFSSATFFQRRLRLASIEVDTAGAAGFALPRIVDLPEESAADLLDTLHTAAQRRARIPVVPALPSAWKTYRQSDGASLRLGAA